VATDTANLADAEAHFLRDEAKDQSGGGDSSSPLAASTSAALDALFAELGSLAASLS
jgi:hypothetical protein